MYRTLLVDDERIILDGISSMVDWPRHRTELIGTAQNGIAAYERIVLESPDIVITDIRMPGLDGLGLVAKTYASHPHIRFIILSGFSEFEYANKAMQYGVKHYLLKPTNENKIAAALDEIVAELDAASDQQAFIANMKQRFQRMVPHVKDQVLKEFVTNKTYGAQDLNYYRSLFEYDFDRPVQLLLFQLEGPAEFEYLFAIKNIAEDILESTLLSTTIGNHVLILIEEPGDAEALQEQLADIRLTFLQYYKHDVTIAVSSLGEMIRARALYQETLQCLNYRFYLGEGGIITAKDILAPSPQPLDDYEFDEERILIPVRSGHLQEAEEVLSELFAPLKSAQLDIGMVKTYAIQQFISLIRLDDPQRINENYKKLPLLLEMNTLQAMQDFLSATVREIAERYYEQNVVKHTSIVRKVIDIIDDQLGNPDLSLNFVAGEMLYMNADYLGKLFKKETGEKFSNYVMKARMKLATQLISAQPDIKIFELAERLGFGDNPQYFSQVFKKQFGCTPSEYMKGTENSAF
ncbi:response regulator [Cohnella thailandensis]|uniref:Response regulator n=1 Tax=Cohnella thailandensis TaxID=557557 RepID=A0A841T0N5_9BACL|nr:response regulator [Cohnella thailandensis]MBB6635640.1 response regulator [Cohnella thailandensis]MBP1976016.1 two-component system response regulator YesN [Cohnella thailandensis]